MKPALLFAGMMALSFGRGVVDGAMVDVRPHVVDGELVTGSYEDATGITSPDERFFLYRFQEDPGDPYFASDPGFNAAAGSGLPPGSQLSFNVVDGREFDWEGNLVYWNGLDANPALPDEQVFFSPAPHHESLTFRLGSSSVDVSNEVGYQPGLVIQTVSASGAVHRHLSTFLNPGEEDVPADGLYLVALKLLSDDETIAPSKPFFLLFDNGATEEQITVAKSWIERFLVSPVPGDANRDGVVDLVDFNALKTKFGTGTRWHEGNFDGNGVTDLADFNLLKQNFGAGAATTVAEPPTLLLAVSICVSSLGSRRWRRRQAVRPTRAVPAS